MVIFYSVVNKAKIIIVPFPSLFHTEQAEIFPVSPGSTLGALSFELAAKIPFENAAALYVERKSAGGYLGDSLSETSIENELEIEIIAGKDLESQYEGEIPSCFVTYSFYTYDICHTNVVINQSFPNFSYVRKHRVEENDNLEKYLATEKLRFVVVDQEDNEEDYLGQVSNFLSKANLILINRKSS